MTAARKLAAGYQSLGERGGPLLLQFPPARQIDLRLLESLLDALAMRVAVEFRHASWFDPAVYGLLHRYGAALVVTDDEKWPQAPLGNTSFGYYRLRREYSDAELSGWAERIAEDRPEGDVFVFFKHYPGAPESARMLQAAFK